MFGAVNWKFREAVGREIGQHLERVRTFHIDVRHVVRLVEEDRCLAPR